MRVLLRLVVVAALVLGGIWLIQDRKLASSGREVRSAIDSMVRQLDVHELGEELKRTGRIVRRKAGQAAREVADATQDARTTAGIKTGLALDPTLSALDISVDTTDGRVTLAGHVDSTETCPGDWIALEARRRAVVSTIQVRRRKSEVSLVRIAIPPRRSGGRRRMASARGPLYSLAVNVCECQGVGPPRPPKTERAVGRVAVGRCWLRDADYEETKMAKVRPLRRLLVSASERKHQGWNHHPRPAKEKPQEGEVIAVGNGKVLENGTKLQLDVKAGDKILFGKYSGTEIKIDGEEYLILREDEVLAVIS
jgi:chaperonin GroES